MSDWWKEIPDGLWNHVHVTLENKKQAVALMQVIKGKYGVAGAHAYRHTEGFLRGQAFNALRTLELLAALKKKARSPNSDAGPVPELNPRNPQRAD